MRSGEKTSKLLNLINVQVAIIVIAFALMGFLSYYFVSRIEREHLENDAKNALSSTEAEILAGLQEPETFLGGYSETIRSMILRGDDENKLSVYMQDITNFMLNNRDRMTGFNGTYGFFEKFGGKYISGRNWTPPDDFVIRKRPWYTAATAANGRIAATEPYTEMLSGKTVITFSRRIFDNERRSLGIVCLDVIIEGIISPTLDLKLTPNSYGLLLNNQLDVIAHPYIYEPGVPLYGSMDHDIAVVAEELEHGGNITERRVKNFSGENSVVFFRQIKYGWYLGVVTPVREYYRSVRQMALFLVVLASALASALSVMLYHITKAKRKSDIRTQQKSNFLATMSHEIRTPLNAILGITEIQLQNNTLSTDIRIALAKIYNSGDLLLCIINDILDLSKIEAGKLELTPEKYETASLINDIVQLNIVRYESSPVEFKLKVDENIPSTLVGDELRIKQILNNLLSNAFKYTDRGEVTMTVNAECIGRGGAVLVTLVFQVSDTGRGMTAEQVRKLFDEYTRFNLEANRSTEGTGLGMTITRNLVELMQGKIAVKSVVGEGTTVTVRLPQKTDGIGISGMIGKELAENLQQFKLSNIIQEKKAQIKYEPMPYGHVLIVDDVETNLFVAKGLMTPYGLKIDTAMSGFEAIDKIKDGNAYDIIFMDHMMPKMDGIEATKQIRGMGYNHPIVALTANALAGQAEVFLKSGFDGFISKPIDIRQLNISLIKLIHDKQSVEVIETAHRERTEQDKKQIAATVNQSVAPQLAEIFARDAEKALTVIETVHKNNFRTDSDLQTYIINIHAMKSALANVGEASLSAVAQTLEHEGREKNISLIASKTQEFLEELQKVITKIKPVDDETAEDTEDDRKYLNEKLLAIREACAAYEKKTAKNILAELRDKTWSHNTKELLNTIAEHILHSEFDEAVAVADDYLRK
jgi:signal transduction histidine kinase/CheY-like chemotaxis protein